ncbi:hypothetical protein COU00_04080 [Candidatus Falkowbacteria bacterium CG10_big_fil_rev_8_21_14_0_10_43_11]|uniref:Uncharacterized protein n=1 Tax=Candidatus Falkowbacteria bacterium CG10_big_fil_rev_8_21_14_0_10_43_11 TaxID=1974568 RepID=A0A2M6WL15_9BACT|nr:MAG: hypothetical protein COU00_04080 [Candidatus Falkowbacteria bacterium CG10_big_fil_rev_8_21_14_0_10_43_11]
MDKYPTLCIAGEACANVYTCELRKMDDAINEIAKAGLKVRQIVITQFPWPVSIFMLNDSLVTIVVE